MLCIQADSGFAALQNIAQQELEEVRSPFLMGVMAMVSVELSYYYGYESEQFSFYRIPKLLFTDNCLQR